MIINKSKITGCDDIGQGVSNRRMIILSLFDGMSCGQIALNRSKIKYKKYYASEIDKYAIQVTQKNYPKTIQLGDITKWKDWDIEQPDLIMGGSPCQGFSFAGKRLNFKDERSKLFFTFADRTPPGKNDPQKTIRAYKTTIIS